RQASTPTELPGSYAVDTRSVLGILSGKSGDAAQAAPKEEETNRISKSASTPSGTVSKVQQIARDVGRNQTDMPNPLEESSPSEEAPPPKKSPERGRRETSRKPEEAA